MPEDRKGPNGYLHGELAKPEFASFIRVEEALTSEFIVRMGHLNVSQTCSLERAVELAKAMIQEMDDFGFESDMAASQGEPMKVVWPENEPYQKRWNQDLHEKGEYGWEHIPVKR